MKTIKQKTCLNRLLGYCPECARDYDPNHHPNNYDCEKYKEVEILSLEIKDLRDKK